VYIHFRRIYLLVVDCFRDVQDLSSAAAAAAAAAERHQSSLGATANRTANRETILDQFDIHDALL